MAVTPIYDASVTVDGTDLSDHVRAVNIEVNYDEADTTAMGDSYRQRVPSTADGRIVVDFLQDYASGSVDATLWPLVGDSSGFTVVVKPASGAVAVTNPSYTATCNLYTYNPINVSNVGEVTVTSVNFLTSGAITRATTP